MVSSLDERGQLLLVGAIAIGVVILGSVVLLNDMKFTDTVGSQGNQQALQNAERTEEMMRTDLQGMVVRVREGTANANFADALAENVSAYSRYYSNMTFQDGIVFVNAEFKPSESKAGRLIEQPPTGTTPPPGPDGFWLHNPGTNDWTVASDAYFMSPFVLTVEEFPDTVAAEPNTTVSVTGRDGHTWELVVNRSDFYGTDEPTLVAILDDERVGRIRTGPGVEVDLERGEINDTAEPGFDYAEYLDAPYTVEVHNNGVAPGSTNAAKGGYEFGTDSTVQSTGGKVSQLTAARPAVEITYQRPELQYTTTIFLDEGGGS